MILLFAWGGTILCLVGIGLVLLNSHTDQSGRRRWNWDR